MPMVTVILLIDLRVEFALQFYLRYRSRKGINLLLDNVSFVMTHDLTTNKTQCMFACFFNRQISLLGFA